MLNRRTVVVASLAGLSMLTAADLSGALAKEAMRGPAVRVDVSELDATGAHREAVRIQNDLQRDLASVLDPALRRQGAALVVVVHSINMPSYAGNDSDEGAGGTMDGMETTATLIGANGQVVATYPIVSSSSAESAGPWYAPDIDMMRLDKMAQINASWIERYVNE